MLNREIHVGAGGEFAIQGRPQQMGEGDLRRPGLQDRRQRRRRKFTGASTAEQRILAGGKAHGKKD
jgi:hypothetical protein